MSKHFRYRTILHTRKVKPFVTCRIETWPMTEMNEKIKYEGKEHLEEDTEICIRTRNVENKNG